MHEIEVKAALRDKEGVMRALEERGVSFSEPVTEEDVLYALDVSGMEGYNRNRDYLRIRVRGDGQTIFTLKHHPDRHEGRPDSMPLEHETTIGSKEAVEGMLALMGYQEAVRISKTRQKGKFGKREVCVDEVPGLGSFIEIEELGAKEDMARIVEELLEELNGLGIAREDMFADRYDIALLKKRWGV
mgnify:CR=1 FL=1